MFREMFQQIEYYKCNLLIQTIEQINAYNT